MRRPLDVELVRRGLADSRTEAREAIAERRVMVDGAPALKPATQVHPSQSLAVAGPPPTYVSRGGEKLKAALDRFDVDPTGRRCLDAGASTGGFTDCLLQHGADHVVAIDVGYGQLHARLRDDPRVTVIERTNVRTVGPDDVPGEPPDLVTADLSFISLRLVLPALREVAAEGAEAIVLCKPQFEAERGEVKGGVVRDEATWRRVIEEVSAAAAAIGWGCVGVVASPLVGPAGNVEFLLHLRQGPPASDLGGQIDAAIAEGPVA